MWLVAALPNEPGDNFRWRDLGAAGLPFYVMMLYALATIVPTCAVTVRRLHDYDYSGWWLLLGFIPYWRSGTVCPALLQRHGGRQPLWRSA